MVLRLGNSSLAQGLPYFIRLFSSFLIMIDATLNLDLVWNISDAFNGLMAIPNLIGVLALSETVIRITKERDG